jgi:aspartyl-tRNA(Asn)/glutamyl-tRNA(Gln) amidotransferase subunit A
MDHAEPISSLREKLISKEISCIDIVQSCLDNINAGKNLNAFLEIFEKEAIASAKEINNRAKTGKLGKLAGAVIGIKDNLCYKDHLVSAASKILQGFQSIYSAHVVDQLIKEDAIIIGRLNCDEFAMGSSNENSAYGIVHNPINPNKIPGGSSGGAAAAVKTGMCHAALGTDTGGSIRQPASLCGIVGLKPTYGRVSRNGCIAYASSFDQIGPMTSTVEDAALILEVIAGPDTFDATLSSHLVPEYSQDLKLSGKKKFAILKDCMDHKGLDPEIKQRINKIGNHLKAQGHIVEDVRFPYMDFLVPAYYVLTTAEASSNLARYDGIRYGYRTGKADGLDPTYRKSRTEGFGAEVKRRIMLGTFVLSAGYYDAYYSKAQKIRRIIQDKTLEILKEYDFILLPSTPGTAPEIGEKINDPIAMYLEDIFTVQANLTGIPSISLPLGKHSNGLPFGIQLMANKMKEDSLLAVSNYLMSAFRVE